MQKMIISLAACVFLSMIACVPAMGKESGKLNVSNDIWGLDQESFQKDNRLLLAYAAEPSPADISNDSAKSGKTEYTPEQIAEMINNPLSHLWLLWIQNDTSWWSGDILDKFGEDDKVMNSTLIQPVMPMQITDKWKMIVRPIIPINSFDTISGFNVPEIERNKGSSLGVDFQRETGLGDIVLWTAFSNTYKPPFIFGFGPTIMMDTATDKSLGTGKWSAGPMALAFYIGEKWIYGAVAQHWWSFAGDDERNSVNLTDIQYVLRYRLTPETNIGFGPNIRANWDADSDDRWTVPVGLGFDTLVNIGPLPVKIGLEGYYYVEKPDAFGPKFGLRFIFTPVVPSPEWSK